MAKANPEHTSPSGADEWTLDDAFRYLTRVVGVQDSLAIYKLNEALLSGQLPATCRHLRDDEPPSEGVVRPDFWRDHLTVALADERAQVRALKALQIGEYTYSVSSQVVRMIWPPSSVSSKEEPKRRAGRKPEFDVDAYHAKFVQLVDDGGTSPDNISKYTEELLVWGQEHFAEDVVPEFQTLRQYVRKWLGGYERSLLQRPRN
jgi:hypothetical protein